MKASAIKTPRSERLRILPSLKRMEPTTSERVKKRADFFPGSEWMVEILE
jgi:hypothetical protein